MQNAGLDEAQADIKIAGTNINNLKYADDTTLMAERKEELKTFLLKLKKESEKFGLKLHIQKMKSWHAITFLIVWEFLWYNCSAVRGSSAWWLYGGANGNILQEVLCHPLHVPGLLQPEPLSPQ